MTMTSSVSLRFQPLDRNSAPRIGRSPRPGVLLIVLLCEFWSSPPIIIDWPEPRISVVSARLVVSAGMVVPLIWTAPSEVSCDTSGRTRSEICPLDSTVGV